MTAFPTVSAWTLVHEETVGAHLPPGETVRPTWISLSRGEPAGAQDGLRGLSCRSPAPQILLPLRSHAAAFQRSRRFPAAAHHDARRMGPHGRGHAGRARGWQKSSRARRADCGSLRGISDPIRVGIMKPGRVSTSPPAQRRDDPADATSRVGGYLRIASRRSIRMPNLYGEALTTSVFLPAMVSSSPSR